MKAPLGWLKEYVEIDVSMEELARRMIMQGLGIEGIERVYEQYDSVVVGRLNSIEDHPDADRLKVCTVDLGNRHLRIITAAPNVYEGMICPIAQSGTLLPIGKEIKAGEMRGVLSEGMLCSGDELLIYDDEFPGASVDGILDMGEIYADKLGQPFFTATELDDYVIDFEINANRGDCLNMLGIAREVSAALGSHFREPTISFETSSKKAERYVSVDVRDIQLCPRYIARVITDINIEPSPLWLRRRLEAAGVRPISNIVDITNYVMLEYGQPLHAFDFDNVKNGEIIVRRAYEGETVATLDDKERELNPDMLVIADPAGPVALAGVMGGANSEIKPGTKMVLLESANFNAGNNRHTSRALGLASESSTRYSKGIDPVLASIGSLRAAQLIAVLGCGKVMSGCVDTFAGCPTSRRINVSARKINRILGTEIPVEVMKQCLERVFITSEEQDDDALECTVPAQRADVQIEEDIAEEIAKVYGYDDIPVYPLFGEARGGRNQRQLLRARVREHMRMLGLHESITFAFTSKRAFDDANFAENDARRDCPRILNPIGEDMSMARTTIIPAMMKALALNEHNKNENVGLFEISNVHECKPDEDGLPTQRAHLAVGLAGESFFRLKGMLDSLFTAFGLRATYEAAGPEYYHPGRKATIWLGNYIIGEMGELHPDTLLKLEMDERACVAELDMDLLLDSTRTEKSYKPLPKYPALERDMALSVNRNVNVGPMIELMYETAGELLEDVSLFDVYEGEQAGEGKKSVAFALSFRAEDRTMNDEEANILFDRMCAALERKFGARLRGA